jgi:glycosyltransferase involved in cell wall biosynthesis
MSSRPAISIITVCYNSAAHIADALRSVDIQTWHDHEHIVVDGASTDDTLRIVESYSRAGRRLLTEPDRGIYDAMNKGIALAAGEVIGFLNSDDFYASADTLGKVAEVFNDRSVDACYGDLCYVRADQPDRVVRYWRSSAFKPGLFRTGWCPPHPTFFVRRGIYERLGGFDLGYRMANDIELMARFVEVHKIRTHYLPELLVSMRLGGESNRSWSAVLLQNREIWRAMKQLRLRPALLPFVVGKLWSRGLQFLSRPN